MSTQKALQPLNCNVDSPQRKRPRLDSLGTCKVSSSSNEFSVDDKPEELLFDMGVKMLRYVPDDDSNNEDDDEYMKYKGPDLTDYESNPDTNDCGENKPPSNRSSNGGSDTDVKSSVNSSRCSLSTKSDSVENFGKEWNQFTTKHMKDDVNVSNVDYFATLSDEIVLLIFRWLPKVMLARVSSVSHRWSRLVQDESLWTRLDVSNRFLEVGVLGNVISRQCVALRLAQTEISFPSIIPNTKAFQPEFRSRLLFLDLSLAQISLPCLKSLISKCVRLKKISLESVTVNNDVCELLAKNKDLEVLNFCMTRGVELCGLKKILEKCYKLRELNIAWTHLETSAVRACCRLLPDSLNRLNISGCRKTLKDSGVEDIVRRCPNLRELDLSDCTALSEKSIHSILLLQELNFLSLSRCYLIPYTSLLSLRSISSLVYLDVHGGHISDQEIAALCETYGARVHINKFLFSSIARPTVGNRRSSIWGLRVRD